MKARYLFLFAGLFMSSTACAGVDERLRSCAALKSAESRLLCYDMLAESLGVDIAPGAGESQGAPTKAAPGSGPAAVEGRAVKVSTVVRDVYGMIVVELSNGEFWRQDESGRVGIEAGDSLLMVDDDAGSTVFILPDQSRVRFTRNP